MSNYRQNMKTQMRVMRHNIGCIDAVSSSGNAAFSVFSRSIRNFHIFFFITEIAKLFATFFLKIRNRTEFFELSQS